MREKYSSGQQGRCDGADSLERLRDLKAYL